MIMIIAFIIGYHPLFERITWICTAILCLIGIVIAVTGSVSIIIGSLQ
jgi:hypothetical protein